MSKSWQIDYKVQNTYNMKKKFSGSATFDHFIEKPLAYLPVRMYAQPLAGKKICAHVMAEKQSGIIPAAYRRIYNGFPGF